MNKNFQLEKLNVHRIIKFCSNVTDDTLLALKRFQIVATVGACAQLWYSTGTVYPNFLL